MDAGPDVRRREVHPRLRLAGDREHDLPELLAPFEPFVCGSRLGQRDDRVDDRRRAGRDEVEVELTWDPPWTPDRMSDDAKFILGFG